MIGRPAKRVSLKPEEKLELERLSKQKRKTRGAAFRAQIVLSCAKGRTDTEVARLLRTSNNTVGMWRGRFLERGMEGLLDEPRAGAPRKVGDERIEEVVTRTLETTPEGATHWSTRLMARKLCLSQSTVSRVCGLLVSSHTGARRLCFQRIRNWWAKSGTSSGSI